jgi:succinyl-CoA synthetase beta subunit
MAEGIAKAVKELKPSIPIVTVIRGTGEEEAIEMLKDAGLEPLSDTEDAVNKVLALVGGGAK